MSITYFNEVIILNLGLYIRFNIEIVLNKCYAKRRIVVNDNRWADKIQLMAFVTQLIQAISFIDDSKALQNQT